MEYPRNTGQWYISQLYLIEILQEEMGNGAEETFENIMAKNVPKINDRHQITDPRNRKNIKEVTHNTKQINTRHVLFKLLRRKC